MAVREISLCDFQDELGTAENHPAHSRDSDVAGNTGNSVIPGTDHSGAAGDPDLRDDRSDRKSIKLKTGNRSSPKTVKVWRDLSREDEHESEPESEPEYESEYESGPEHESESGF